MTNAIETPKKTQVAVLYNGAVKKFDYRSEELVSKLLATAIEKFGVTSNQHLLSLFKATGEELADAATLGAQGVRAGQELIMRQGVVKGG